jgi:dTDP-glucose 4,6-dehydratase
VELVIQRGEPGSAYSIGGGKERENQALAERVRGLLGKPHRLMQPVVDRPGHDRRYAVDTTRLHAPW